MTITDMFRETDIPEDYTRDTAPVSGDIEYPCEVCGREAGPYGGRGRKPKKCADCKPKAAQGRKAPGTSGANATLAGQAVEALWQINGVAAFLAMIAGLPMTGLAIQEREASFREMAYNALLTDASMCRFILKGGMQSSKVSLTICYAMFAASVMPVALTEIKAKRAKAAAEQYDEATVQMDYVTP